MSELSTKVNKLLKKTKNGDNNAFEKLIDSIFNRLVFIATDCLIDKSKADAIVEEAFISVYQSLSAFDESKNGYSWICEIVESKAKKTNKSEKIFEELASDAQTLKTDNSENQKRNDTDIILSKLNEEDYIYITERFYFDRTFEQIAQKMGVTVKQASTKIDEILNALMKN